MGRTNDNQIKSYRKISKLTLEQLKKWNVKFHKLFISKPSADLYMMINHGVITLIGKLNLKNTSMKNKKNNISKLIRKIYQFI